jgi:hypothetical protein
LAAYAACAVFENRLLRFDLVWTQMRCARCGDRVGGFVRLTTSRPCGDGRRRVV